MAFVPTQLIEVIAWGRTVGALASGRTRGAYVFEYDPAWVRSGIEISPIHMPTSQRRYTFPSLSQKTFQGLPPAIADALPDKFGNGLVDAWLAREGVPVSSITALDRLAYLGGRGLGALEFQPDTGAKDLPPTALDLQMLVQSARDAVAGTLNSEGESKQALQQIITVGTSAGGARAKAVVNFNSETQEIRPGHVLPSDGFEAWLLKFDGVGDDHQLGKGGNYGRIEYAYSKMARAAGITMTETRLLEENGRAHFMTKRFDRTAERQKLHTQSLCGMSILDFNTIGVHDYAQYQGAIGELELGASARTEAFRRMVFNVVAANCDDHTKNFGFLMDPDGLWSLAPAYDITHAFNPEGEWTHQHLMSVNGRFEKIRRQDFLTFAERHGVERAASIIGEVNDAVRSWPEFAKEAGLPAAATAVVAKDHHEVAPAKKKKPAAT
ncbi:type II toxin-antitoxin system HipA family toxin (plasmid) [Glaciihabitans sp. INWT7]|uniref:type II toxin-antitoxin system HipA family toxin n=1 Tax=Glaciihabitans sp. INWT7 TaxID=2596912 RepID=UPI00162901F9|nr:type II toxin-antitoxin system HipA family toxin [Glaciihabitans sp. INWT7]QNE48603.1 type II toxin-antitoxin system HipA family toxin [Glaciihabitans sp. INWT7]